MGRPQGVRLHGKAPGGCLVQRTMSNLCTLKAWKPKLTQQPVELMSREGSWWAVPKTAASPQESASLSSSQVPKKALPWHCGRD